MNEEEYFEAIRKIKRDRGISVLDDPGTAADYIEGAVRQPIQALAGAAKAIPAGYKALFKYGRGEGEYPFQEVNTAMSGAMRDVMYEPENRAQQAGAKFSSFGPEMAEKVLRWLAEKSGEVTGSDKVGAAVYTAPNALAFPGLFTAILGRSLANARRFGAFAGSHSPIDVSAHR